MTTQESKEEKKFSHPYFSNYSVDEQGQIYNCGKLIKQHIAKKEGLKMAYVSSISPTEKLKRFHIYVHRFVFECSSGQRLAKNEFITFKDGNKLNICTSNLIRKPTGVRSGAA